MNKTAFVISIVLTTFVLMAVGGIAYATRPSPQPQVDSLPSPAPIDSAAIDPITIDMAAIDPALQQALNEREAAYQQMIAEANARLEQSQKQQQILQSQVETLLAGSTPVAPQSTITPEQAAEIASAFLGQTGVYSVEAVSIKGETLYKVTFYSGDIVYVDLAGQVVGSATVKLGHGSGGKGVAVGSNPGSLGEGGEHGEEYGEHEGGEYDD